MNLVLLGPPGAGKGTQASLLSHHLGVPHVASGDLFREAMKRGTELGRSAQSYIARGALVPDEVTNGMVQERLKEPDCSSGVVLDGYPRTIEQAQALDRILTQENRVLDGVLLFQVSEEALIQRLSGRRVCQRCQANYHLTFNPPSREGVCDSCGGELCQRPDDREETVRMRFQVYLEETEPLVDYYRRRGLLMEVDGEDEVLNVQAQILSAIRIPQ